jgi:hypothetical protein
LAISTESDYTSIHERIKAYVQSREGGPETDKPRFRSFPPESAPALSTEPGTAQENGNTAYAKVNPYAFTNKKWPRINAD